jgi:phage tail-like protein
MAETVHGSNRFYLEIGGKNTAVFTEVSGLQIETEIMEYMEGGNNDYVHKLPGRTRVGNITLKHGVTTSQELLGWFVKLTQGKIERKNVSVVIYGLAKSGGGSAAREIVRYNFNLAYPVKWSGPQLSAASTSVAIETLELAHAGFSLVSKGD